MIEIVGELPGTSGNNNPATPQNNPSFSVNSSNNESCQNTGSVNKRKPVEKLGRVRVRKVATWEKNIAKRNKDSGKAYKSYANKKNLPERKYWLW